MAALTWFWLVLVFLLAVGIIVWTGLAGVAWFFIVEGLKFLGWLLSVLLWPILVLIIIVAVLVWLDKNDEWTP